jgi:hypothetical protein
MKTCGPLLSSFIISPTFVDLICISKSTIYKPSTNIEIQNSLYSNTIIESACLLFLKSNTSMLPIVFANTEREVVNTQFEDLVQSLLNMCLAWNY